MIDTVLPSEEVRIAAGCRVALHFSVRSETGTEIDNSRTGRHDPVELVVGDGSLLDGFEQVIIGLRAGDRRTATLAPEEAFGVWNKDNVQLFDSRAFDEQPQIGMVMEFEDKNKNTLPGVVKAVGSDQIEVDFNHPLAGQTLLFEVEIFKVVPAGQTPLTLI